MKIFKYDIKFNTFPKKKLHYIDDRFGVYLITGKQGTNKTYYACYLTTLQDRSKVNYIKTNIHSLNIPGYKIHYFTKIDEIYFDTDENCIYIIDEISRKYKKNTPTDTQFYAWLNQCRKRKRVAILITQEYKELPMWLRRPCKYNITSSGIPLLTKLFGIYKCSIGDGYNISFNKDEGEYETPIIQYTIYKRVQDYANMYDTFEPINDL